MGEYNFDVDTVDIFVVLFCVAMGFSVITHWDLWHFEEFINAGCIITGLAIKRVMLKTRPKREDVPVLTRMLYLLAAISGSGSLLMALLLASDHQAFMDEPSWSIFMSISRWPLMLGLALLSFALYLERIYLRGEHT